jgi:hypothetical protein
MKTIALSMIFSLAVIVCEGQTLFAPHFVTFDFQAPNSTNSLVPIAGVNRSVPLAGASYNPGKGASRAIVHPQYSPSGPDRKPKNNIWIVDTGGGLTSVESLGQAQRNSSDGLNGPGMHDSVHDIRGEDDGPLVWDAPRGYFGVAGSANPGGDDI